MAIADLPYLHAAGDGGPRSQTQMVVIHATDNTASAYGEASYATHRPDQTSAHFYVDDGSAYRALPLDDIAYGCYPIGNSRSVQFELCGLSNQISDATMRQAAPLVAEVCQRYGIPIRHIGPAELVNGVRGICGHADVTNAWHQGDHTDPGASFDWGRFINYVAAAANPQEDDMPAGIPTRAIPQTGGDSANIWPVNAGAAGNGPAWLNVCNDTNGQKYAVRLWANDGRENHWYPVDPNVKDGIYVLGSGQRLSVGLPDGTCCLSVSRVPVAANTPVYQGPLTYCVEYGFPVHR